MLSKCTQYIIDFKMISTFLCHIEQMGRGRHDIWKNLEFAQFAKVEVSFPQDQKNINRSRNILKIYAGTLKRDWDSFVLLIYHGNLLAGIYTRTKVYLSWIYQHAKDGACWYFNLQLFRRHSLSMVMWCIKNSYSSFIFLKKFY